jgi:hypothetical protein
MFAAAQISTRFIETVRGAVLDVLAPALAHSVMAKESFDKELRGRWRLRGSAILRT